MAKGRFTCEDWISEAKHVLITSGVDDVKVDRLARRLKVTRGSFYWHFANRKALLDALLHDWETTNRHECEEIESRWAGHDADFAEIFRVWLGEDPDFSRFDLAVRNWARKDPEVATVARAIGDRWITLLQSFFTRSGFDPSESLVRARVIYYHQIGYYALAVEESLAERARLSPTYFRVLTGMAPTAGLTRTLEAMLAGTSQEKSAKK